ncbi:hypothetical protein DFH05DRAFT_1387386 [Lentinula detonsa]|uniref:Uncharacterized protein n=1 Tax=Lentinula detonsa TaxID=2804962 RepID=A0A9W8PA29_9AGAR|nr:hypothetical protein DFH05DRAFT_1387386 [Lentinula detonsa]
MAGPQNKDKSNQNQTLGEGVKFDHQVTTEGTLADVFCIFMEGETMNEVIN